MKVAKECLEHEMLYVILEKQRDNLKALNSVLLRHNLRILPINY